MLIGQPGANLFSSQATVGYGDIVAVTIAEKVVAMGVMLLGARCEGPPWVLLPALAASSARALPSKLIA